MRKYLRLAIDHGHTFFGLLHVAAPECSEYGYENDTANDCCQNRGERIIPLNGKLYLFSEKHGKDSELELLHGAFQQVLKPLTKVTKRRFEILSKDRLWKCHSIFILYCCKIPESKYMTGVKHGRTLHPSV